MASRVATTTRSLRRPRRPAARPASAITTCRRGRSSSFPETTLPARRGGAGREQRPSCPRRSNRSPGDDPDAPGLLHDPVVDRDGRYAGVYSRGRGREVGRDRASSAAPRPAVPARFVAHRPGGEEEHARVPQVFAGGGSAWRRASGFSTNAPLVYASPLRREPSALGDVTEAGLRVGGAYADRDDCLAGLRDSGRNAARTPARRRCEDPRAAPPHRVGAAPSLGHHRAQPHGGRGVARQSAPATMLAGGRSGIATRTAASWSAAVTIKVFSRPTIARARRTAAAISDSGAPSDSSCFGRARRLDGHSRVPAPPPRITAKALHC